MREYAIVFAPSAYEDLDEILNWLSREAPEKVPEWYAAIKAHIHALSHLPERCPYAPENGLWGNDELRQLLFQDYPSKYRIIFTVTESRVQILICFNQSLAMVPVFSDPGEKNPTHPRMVDSPEKGCASAKMQAIRSDPSQFTAHTLPHEPQSLPFHHHRHPCREHGLPILRHRQVGPVG